MTQTKTIADAGSTPAASTILLGNIMNLTKKYLKTLIVEEYENLKKMGMIKAGANPFEIQQKIFEYTEIESSSFLWRQSKQSFVEIYAFICMINAYDGPVLSKTV